MRPRPIQIEPPRLELRKVFKRIDRYVCGVCRMDYETSSEAHDCLKFCLDMFYRKDPVKLKVQRLIYRFQCRLCRRSYDRRSLAFDCAVDCKANDLKKSMLTDAEISALIRIIPKRTRKAPSPQAIVPPVKSNRSVQSGVKMDPSPASDANLEAVGGEPQASVTDEATVRAVPDGPKKKRSDFKDPWFRDQAKYVCACCLNKYFTRIEVMQCFGGHFKE